MTIRRRLPRWLASIAMACLGSSQLVAQTRDGAVLGGVAGAVIGGIVGHQNDETPEGALIGGAVGAIAGGVLGRQQEQQRQIQYYQQQQARPSYHTHTYHHPAPVYSTHVHTAPVYTSTVRSSTVRRPVCVTDVITLVRSGVSESVIANHIHANGIISHPSVDDVLTMHDAGVSDYVIDAMQRAPISNAVVVTQPTISTAPVVIHEEIHTAPVYVSRPTYPAYPKVYSHPSSRPTHLQAVPSYRRNF